MKPEGRIAIGLDEFMLRLGHLSIISTVLPSVSPGRERLAKRIAERLTQPTPIEESHQQAIGVYLAEKGIARVRTTDGSMRPPHPKARYQHLEVIRDSDGVVQSIISDNGHAPEVWYEDWAISQSEVESKVGAVTVDVAYLGNKSGVSHLIDWATILGITNPRLAATSEGRLLGSLMSLIKAFNPAYNPYNVGPLKLFYTWTLFAADGDVLRHIVSQIPKDSELGKKESVDLGLRVWTALRSDIHQVPASGRVINAVRNLENDWGVRRKTPNRATLWHRLSSRLENLVDLGWLSKQDPRGEDRAYEYYYRATPQLEKARELLQATDSMIEWLESSAALLYRPVNSSAANIQDLFDSINLNTGPTGIHLDSFALGAATVALSRGRYIAVGEARSVIERLALEKPEIARLSRGYTGSRAEFASIRTKELQTYGPTLLEPFI